MTTAYAGVPYHPRSKSKVQADALKKHQYQSEAQVLKAEDVQCILVASDTQQRNSVVVVVACDKDDNLHVVQACFTQHMLMSDQKRNEANMLLEEEAKAAGKPYVPVRTLSDIMSTEYYRAETSFVYSR